MDAQIIGVPKNGGTWDVTWLNAQAGWLEGTAFPTWAGNTIITAHSYLQDGWAGPFSRLEQLRFGDRINIQAWGQQYAYEVRQTRVIRAAEFADYTEHYLQRVIVRAVQVAIE